MSAKLTLEARTFPSRIADLGFTTKLPADWIVHDLPQVEEDLSNPTVMVPLAVMTAPHAAIIFAFAARPAYDDGTLHDWTWYLLNHHQLKPSAVGEHQVGNMPAMVGEATQESEVGTLVVRFAFFEDGNRLVNITLTAPEMLAGTVQEAWTEMLKSFVLETPRGSRFGTKPVAAETPAPAAPEPVAKAAPEPPKAPVPANTFALHALADDAGSLDQGNQINNNLLQKGVGMVPNIVATNDEAKRATLAAGAIMAQFDVPYGWHVIDDGKRTLVFEPSGKVQINMSLLPREGRGDDAILDDIEAEARGSYAAPEFMRLKEGRMQVLGVRNIQDGAQALEQYHLLWPFRDDKMVLRARVTATPELNTKACNLAELILESMAFDCFQQRDEPKPQADESPAWWQRALELEAAGKLKEAEKVIKDGVPHLAFAAATADMYRLRMLRLQEVGDKAGAKAAFKEADQWIGFYASQATSGGEGAALSEERDQFRAQLVGLYDGDPGAE